MALVRFGVFQHNSILVDDTLLIILANLSFHQVIQARLISKQFACVGETDAFFRLLFQKKYYIPLQGENSFKHLSLCFRFARLLAELEKMEMVRKLYKSTWNDKFGQMVLNLHAELMEVINNDKKRQQSVWTCYLLAEYYFLLFPRDALDESENFHPNILATLPDGYSDKAHILLEEAAKNGNPFAMLKVCRSNHSYGLVAGEGKKVELLHRAALTGYPRAMCSYATYLQFNIMQKNDYANLYDYYQYLQIAAQNEDNEAAEVLAQHLLYEHVKLPQMAPFSSLEWYCYQLIQWLTRGIQTKQLSEQSAKYCKEKLFLLSQVSVTQATEFLSRCFLTGHDTLKIEKNPQRAQELMTLLAEQGRINKAMREEYAKTLLRQAADHGSMIARVKLERMEKHLSFASDRIRRPS